MQIIEEEGLRCLLHELRTLGYKLIGPKLENHAIVYDELEDVGDIPKGWIDEQGAGSYSLHRSNDDILFGFVAGPHSWKQFLFPPRKQVFSVSKQDKGFKVSDSLSAEPLMPKYAFIGVRACDLHAIAIQDKVFAGGEFADPSYSSLRREVFVLAVNCTRAGENCFCVSMNTGPKVDAGFDLGLTEVVAGDEHYFVLEVGSKRGEDALRNVPHRAALPVDEERANAAVHSAAEQMGKQMNTTNIKQLLYENTEHAEWDNVAKRCLTCANCTMVCPTCFCSTVEDVTDLTGDHAERWRRWDSCFTLDFARVAGGSFRSSPKSRYRQWLTHKLASWQDQFGTLGCVGCGRCITWCPVGIDITEEVRAIRGEPAVNRNQNQRNNVRGEHANRGSRSTP